MCENFGLLVGKINDEWNVLVSKWSNESPTYVINRSEEINTKKGIYNAFMEYMDELENKLDDEDVDNLLKCDSIIDSAFAYSNSINCDSRSYLRLLEHCLEVMR